MNTDKRKKRKKKKKSPKSPKRRRSQARRAKAAERDIKERATVDSSNGDSDADVHMEESDDQLQPETGMLLL